MDKIIVELKSSIASMRQKGCEKIMVDIDFLEALIVLADETPVDNHNTETPVENPNTQNQPETQEENHAENID